jgi:hypothetical protein
VSIARIRGFLARATDSERYDAARWYPTARAIAKGFADEARIDERTAAGVVAAISPGLKWERNLICARALVLWHVGGRVKRDEPVVETYAYRNVLNALRILDGEDPGVVLTGVKVRAFFHAILGENRGAVLDGHVANALRGEDAGLREVVGIRVSEYRAWRAAFAYVANVDGWDVHTLQAVVWLVHKREKDNRLPF